MRVLSNTEFPHAGDRFVIAVDHLIFEELLIQELKRNFTGSEQTFLALRNVEITPSKQGEGHFKKLLQFLESSRPAMVDNIVNPTLPDYLKNSGWSMTTYKKENSTVFAAYKL
jgi:hypothetical protein